MHAAFDADRSSTLILGGSSAPYIKSLSTSGATMTQSFAVTHPSEPNYLDLFSGSNQGVTNDSCPHTFSTANLGSELVAAGKSFLGTSTPTTSCARWRTCTACRTPVPAAPRRRSPTSGTDGSRSDRDRLRGASAGKEAQ